MTWFQIMRSRWHPSDQQMLRDQVPSDSQFCNAIFDLQVEGYMTKRKWDKFAGLINEAFSLVEYNGTFNITIQLEAVDDNWESVGRRLKNLKCVHSYHGPVPAFPGWTVVLQFKKFPYSNQLEDRMRTIEKAIYGKRFRELALQKETVEETY